jgi:hypothetical protein
MEEQMRKRSTKEWEWEGGREGGRGGGAGKGEREGVAGRVRIFRVRMFLFITFF